MGVKAHRDGSKKLMLDKPGITLPKGNFLSSFLFFAVSMALAGAGAMGCFFTAFHIALELSTVLWAGAVCALLCSLQFLLGRWKWAAALGLLAVWGLLAWLNLDELTAGCFRVINTVSAAYGDKLDFALPALRVSPLPQEQVQHCITLFAAFLQFPFFWVLSWMLVRHKSVIGAFCLSGVFLLLPLLFSILPEYWALGLLLTFWAFLLMAAPSLRQRRQLVDDRGRFHISGESFLQPSSLMLIPILALCMLLIYHICPPDAYERPEFANEVRAELTDGVNLPAMFRGGTGSGGSRVDLALQGDRRFTGKTVLQVKQDWRGDIPDGDSSYTGQKEYLKSFVGSVYTGASWEMLSSQDARAAEQALGGQKAQTLLADLSQLLPSAADVQSSYILSVKKVDVDTRSIYSPYGLYSPTGVPGGMKYMDDGFVRSSRLFSGPKSYELSAVAIPKEGSSLLDRLSAHAAMTSADPAGCQEALDRLSEEFAQDRADGGLPSAERWKVPEEFKEEFLSGRGRELAERTESYTDFVYENYTQLPGHTREFLEAYLAEHGLTLSGGGSRTVGLHTTAGSFVMNRTDDCYLDYARQVRELLNSQCEYSLTPPTLPQGRDFVEYFLSDSRKGYCVHFATAAVAMLRAAGIPARYAEGYAAPASPGRWVKVPDYNAHAWVEIYWSGIGWLPFEVTPAGPDAPAAYETGSVPDSAETPAPTAAPDAEPTFPPDWDQPHGVVPAPSAAPSPTPQPSGTLAIGEGASGGAGPALLWLLPLGTVLLFFPMLALIRLIRIGHRKRQFRQSDRNKAALCVYAHLLHLYKESYILPFSSATPPEEVHELALKARFSNHKLTPEELSRLTDLAASLEKQLDENLAKYSRLRCKYLRALF